MTRFIYKSLAFLLIAALIFTALELKARRMYASRTDLYFEAASFEKRRDYEVLFLGASALEKGVNPTFFSRPSYNLSFSSQDLYYDWQLLRKYIDRLPNLKIVVDGVSYLSFGFDEEPWAANICKDYLWEFGIWPRSKNLPSMLKHSSVLLVHQPAFIREFMTDKKPVPLSVLDRDINPDIPPKEGTLLYNGYRFHKEHMPQRFLDAHAQKNTDYHAKVYNGKLLNQNIDYVRGMIELCRERGIAYYMITPPYTENYRGKVSNVLKSATAASVNRILAEYPSVAYFNFNEIDIFNETDFYDSDHLNYSGARKFTVLLDRIIGKDPAHSKFEFDFIRISLLTAEAERMASEFEQLAARHPEYPAMNERIGFELMRKGMFARAEAYFMRTLQRDPQHIDALKSLATIHLRLAEHPEALEYLLRLAEREPANPNVDYNIACVHARMNDREESIRWLRSAVGKGFNRWDRIRSDNDLANIRDSDYVKGLLENRQ